MNGEKATSIERLLVNIAEILPCLKHEQAEVPKRTYINRLLWTLPTLHNMQLTSFIKTEDKYLTLSMDSTVSMRTLPVTSMCLINSSGESIVLSLFINSQKKGENIAQSIWTKLKSFKFSSEMLPKVSFLLNDTAANAVSSLQHLQQLFVYV